MQVSSFSSLHMSRFTLHHFVPLKSWTFCYLVIIIVREHAPSIIFMDEIDSIGSSRLGGGSGGVYQYHVMLIM